MKQQKTSDTHKTNLILVSLLIIELLIVVPFVAARSQRAMDVLGSKTEKNPPGQSQQAQDQILKVREKLEARGKVIPARALKIRNGDDNLIEKCWAPNNPAKEGEMAGVYISFKETTDLKVPYDVPFIVTRFEYEGGELLGYFLASEQIDERTWRDWFDTTGFAGKWEIYCSYLTKDQDTTIENLEENLVKAVNSPLKILPLKN
ncbi:MAG: hypothetical protein ABH950_09205 [Candidatus Altiarchaeota archaeon]